MTHDRVSNPGILIPNPTLYSAALHQCVLVHCYWIMNIHTCQLKTWATCLCNVRRFTASLVNSVINFMWYSQCVRNVPARLQKEKCLSESFSRPRLEFQAFLEKRLFLLRVRNHRQRHASRSSLVTMTCK